jgi:diacylglycerol O-acyltransferase / wax synthase
MDDPTNPMMISVMLRFNGQIHYDHFVKTLEDIIKRYRRFRQRIVFPTGIFQRPYWDDDTQLSIENHLERVDLPLPADDAAVEELLNNRMNTPLDFTHPLWKVTLVDNHSDGSIIIVRVHHCIADGISLMQVLLTMTKTSLEAPADLNQNGSQNLGELQANGEPIVTPTMLQADEINQVPSSNTTGQSDQTAVKPKRKNAYRSPNFADMVAAIFRIITRPADPPTILKGPLGKTKKAVWSEDLNVPEVKKIANFKGATINDVLMAVSSGAIRRYMDLHKDSRKRNIRAFILVNMRGRSYDDELGNKFGLVFLGLPLDREQPVERLDAIKSGMDNLKASAEYAATYLILHILGQSPEWLEDLAIRILDTKGTVVATNVPGSRKQLYLADAPIESIVAWVPQSGRIGVGLSFISYNNKLVVGLNADAGLIPDPEVFLQLFLEEYRALQSTVSALTSEAVALVQSV